MSEPPPTWTCHVCGRERPDRLIAVRTSDVSHEHGFPEGTVRENVRYCVDSQSCAVGARRVRFLKPREE